MEANDGCGTWVIETWFMKQIIMDIVKKANFFVMGEGATGCVACLKSPYRQPSGSKKL